MRLVTSFKTQSAARVTASRLRELGAGNVRLGEKTQDGYPVYHDAFVGDNRRIVPFVMSIDKLKSFNGTRVVRK